MERIHVAVRARPLTAEEAKNSPWRISGNSIFIPNQPTKFEFDQIFREDCKTVQVYNARIKDIVAAAVRGFNGTVFAYGQTNSGKTHTMRGTPIEPGVIRLAMQDLFDVIQQEMDREFLLRMSYMEIYNEDINDLLAPEHRKLQIHESIERGIFVAGLREEIVASPEQVIQLMEFGESHRHIGETNMNLYSSRSHTIFRMIIESREKSEDADSDSSCDAVRVSVLNLVDLAGSERAAKTGAEGVRLKEGSHINKSLMTLGTVIKKLSEGAESNGGHVPYRDSKLTRILQPALGGNANTAIICNITLAQIHADETKSSLQFASRAIRVTNCVHVNEILTDAALLKRQKKEIEELRAKLQGSHSEHLEEEILNLRNTLLKSELERERIALELEEEKKAQAEREKRLLEQAKKIENLSSMVLCSNRNEKREVYKKEKRRDTWCPGNLSRETLRELYTVKEEASAEKTMRTKRQMEPLLPFEELVNEARMDEFGEQEEDCGKIEPEECTLPDPHSLLNVTNRRKASTRKKSLPMENNDLLEMQAAYEELLLEFETHRTMSEIQIDYLKRKLAEADSSRDGLIQDNNITINGNAKTSIRESEAILVIKQLQEKITTLEMEKSSSQQNLDCIVELATEQTISAREKYEELYEELLCAQEEVKIAREQHNSGQFPMVNDVENADFLIKLSAEVEELMSEVKSSRNLIESVTPIVDELLLCFSTISKLFLELKSSAYESSVQLKLMISKNNELKSLFRCKIDELEDEKLLLSNNSFDLRNQMGQLKLDIQNSINTSTELSEQFEVEKSELLSQIQNLQKEILNLSSCSLAREKESMRKDLEKTKVRLRDMESKLKNVIQEKTKLEGEKACAERNIKLLHDQKAGLERDINRRMSVIGRKCDLTVDRRTSNVFDSKRSRVPAVAAEQAMQDEYKRLEVLMFEMETTIASLEEELVLAHQEKEEANSRAESLSSELEALADQLNVSNKELIALKEEVLGLRLSLEESESYNQKLKSSASMLEEEKEDLALQLTDALLAMEEEKAIWSAKEKASVEAIEVKSTSYTAEIANLSKGMSEVKNELEICRKECEALKENLRISEENANIQKKYSIEKSLEIDQLRSELAVAGEQNTRSQESSHSQQEILSLEHHNTSEQLGRLQEELLMLKKEKEDLLALVRASDPRLVPSDHCQEQLLRSKNEVEALSGRLESLEGKMQKDEINHGIEKMKLRMRLRGTQMKLDTFRLRYIEARDEMDIMNRRYEAASATLKDKLAERVIEILDLKKELALLQGC